MALRKEIQFYKSDKYFAASKRYSFDGRTGCGKSLSVKVMSRELNLPLYSLDLGKLYSKYIGETEENLRKVLKMVEKLSPMCLWIDEIEKMLRRLGW